MNKSTTLLALFAAATAAVGQQSSTIKYVPLTRAGAAVPGAASTSSQAICEAALAVLPVTAATDYECRRIQTVMPAAPAPAPAPPAPAPAPPPGTWTTVAAEGSSFTLAVSTTVRYGSGTTFITKTFAAGTYVCSNGLFGADPTPGVEKTCAVGGTAPAPSPAPAPAPAPSPAPAPAPSGPLSATRTSGPAPLAVLVDASGMGAFNGIYTFDFGDNRGLNWAISGKPKNTQVGGAIAAHIYDLPGLYTVKVGTSTLTITVTDPNSVWSGANTVCVSPSSNWTGCPTTASHVTAMPLVFAGKRVLLHRGESFAGVNPRTTDSGFQVGAYGTGAKPIVAGVNTGMSGGVAAWPSDWTVMDLDIAGCINIDATTWRFLAYRNDIKRPNGCTAMVNIGAASGWYATQPGNSSLAMPWAREVFVVENDVQGVVAAPGTNGAPNVVAMGNFWKSAIMGNSMDRATEHTLRVFTGSKMFIGHNSFGGNHYAPSPPGIRGAVKIHSAGVQTMVDLVRDAPTPASRQIVLSNNTIGSATYPGSWTSGFSPQNLQETEGLEDCISENNTYVRGPWTDVDMMLRGRRLTARGNVLSTGGPARVEVQGGTYPAGLDNWSGPYTITP